MSWINLRRDIIEQFLDFYRTDKRALRAGFRFYRVARAAIPADQKYTHEELMSHGPNGERLTLEGKRYREKYWTAKKTHWAARARLGRGTDKRKGPRANYWGSKRH